MEDLLSKQLLFTESENSVRNNKSESCVGLVGGGSSGGCNDGSSHGYRGGSGGGWGRRVGAGSFASIGDRVSLDNGGGVSFQLCIVFTGSVA
ncbi:hypothetical protein ElyMa_003196600 [Elysia marginata]|uniref:Uncharacterized protein n=1 Tax=Elysia marginata TaxID=1093978 RepID=A0AAV4J2C9_9GAST|nr:hypothetical protein ElyMa_003196600 [Elysia marginata]